jgi:alkylhydroperoxidase family enzyme
MAERTARDLEARLDRAEGLSDAERTIVQIAEQATRAPQTVAEDDVGALRAAAGSEGDFLEAANVVAQFNFITRVADALGVDLEIPASVRRFAWLRRLAMRATVGLMRRMIDFRARDIAAEDPQSALDAMERLFVKRLGFAKRPAYFDRLLVRPYLLEALAAMLDVFFTRNQLPDATVMHVAAVVADVTGDAALGDGAARWRRAHPNAAPPPAAVLEFATDVSRYAYKVTDEHVERLRETGLDDSEVLDLTAIVAALNGSARLAALLSAPAAASRAARGFSAAAGR